MCVHIGVCAYRNAVPQCSVTTPVCCDTSHWRELQEGVKDESSIRE